MCIFSPPKIKTPTPPPPPQASAVLAPTAANSADSRGAAAQRLGTSQFRIPLGGVDGNTNPLNVP